MKVKVFVEDLREIEVEVDDKFKLLDYDFNESTSLIEEEEQNLAEEFYEDVETYISEHYPELNGNTIVGIDSAETGNVIFDC